MGPEPAVHTMHCRVPRYSAGMLSWRFLGTTFPMARSESSPSGPGCSVPWSPQLRPVGFMCGLTSSNSAILQH